MPTERSHPGVSEDTSADPVSIDKACYDMVRDRGKRFRGPKTFDYAEEIGLGSAKYTLVNV